MSRMTEANAAEYAEGKVLPTDPDVTTPRSSSGDAIRDFYDWCVKIHARAVGRPEVDNLSYSPPITISEDFLDVFLGTVVGAAGAITAADPGAITATGPSATATGPSATATGPSATAVSAAITASTLGAVTASNPTLAANDLVDSIGVLGAADGTQTLQAMTDVDTLTLAGCTADDTVDAEAARVVFSFHVPDMTTIADGDIVTAFTPGFNGTIQKVFWTQGTVACSTGAKGTTLNVEIGTTDVTGGVVTLDSDTNCDVIGEVAEGTAVTAADVFDNTDTISVEAVSTTAFAEGCGTLYIVCSNDDIDDNFKELVDQVATQSTLNGVIADALSTIVAEYNKLKDDTEFNETAVEANIVDIAANRVEIEANIVDVAAAGAEIDALIVDVADNNSEIDALIVDVADNNSEIDALIVDVADNNTEIDALIVDATANRAEIVKLVADVTAVRTAVNGLAAASVGKFSEVEDLGTWFARITDNDSDDGEVLKTEDDATGGWLLSTTNDYDTDANEYQMNGETFKLAAAKPLYFEATVAVQTAAVDVFYLGMATMGLVSASYFSAGALNLPNDFVGFGKDENVNIDYHVRKDGTGTTGDTGVDSADCANAAAIATATTNRLGFYWDGVDTVHLYVDGAEVGPTDSDGAYTGISTNVPSNEALSICFGHATNASETANMWVDKVEVAATR